MLVHLSIRDIVLIRRLDIDFDAGLSVLTGETGAGKSILLDALSLALGARGDSSLVREGAGEGQVTAVFDVPMQHAARSILAAESLDSEDGFIILRRVQGVDGRSRVFVNDRPASVALMRRIGSALVEIHGQHDERALVDTATHRGLLDEWAGLADQLGQVQRAFRHWQDLRRRHAELAARIREAAREAEYLAAALEELDRLDPQPGEEERLAALRADMMRAERIAGDIADAQDLLSGADSPATQLAALMRRLGRKSAEAPELIDPIVRGLDEALLLLDHVEQSVGAAMQAVDFDPARLEEAETRLFALRAAARKHNVQVDELAALRARFAAELAELDAGEERLAELAAEAEAALRDYDAAAGKLSAARKAAAAELSAAVMAELPALKLERAEFLVEIVQDAAERTAAGIDRVEFVVRTNPGSRPGPLMKIASGGELSRFLLALKVALADRGSAPTLVFDEIDAGVGGAVADAIGQRLARLAQRVQVLAVTHAPQVAARAASHYLIRKSPEGESGVATAVSRIDESRRLEEIARMLAGATITEEARAAARRLLADTLPPSNVGSGR